MTKQAKAAPAWRMSGIGSVVAVVAAAAGVAGVSEQAAAQVTPIGPFIGQYFEGFQGGSPSIIPRQCFAASGVFGGLATLCTYSATTGGPVSGLHHLQIAWSQGCSISAFESNRFVGNASGRLGFVFSVGVGEFGGYFGTNHTATANSGGFIEFYDINDTLVSTEFMFLGPCGQTSWAWHGWEFATPIYRIVVYGAASNGGSLTMDALEFSEHFGGPGGCPSDWNNDGLVNSGDISAFLTSWLSSVQFGDLLADFNGDGMVNSGDISAFLSAWLVDVQGGC